jgi:hypothetical protein
MVVAMLYGHHLENTSALLRTPVMGKRVGAVGCRLFSAKRHDEEHNVIGRRKQHHSYQ